MKRTPCPAACLCAFVLGLGAPLFAQELGGPAPPLKVAKWLKGGPVELEAGKGKTAYVVEFWATWCPPCRASIPHLTEVQKKYRDRGLVVVGVTNEKDAEKVAEFVKGQGEKMDYAVAQDDGGETFKRYMDAFEQRGIPHAFVVDKEGRIVWHGHPMVDLDQVLERVLAGTYRLEEARAEEKTARARDEKAKAVREYFLQLRRAQALGEKALEAIRGDAELLNEMAWAILTEKWIRGRDLDLALRVAKAAYDACEGKDPAIVDTYARALFDTGKKEEAIEYQRKAVSLCAEGQDQLKAELEKTLREYESAVGAASKKPRKTVRL